MKQAKGKKVSILKGQPIHKRLWRAFWIGWYLEHGGRKAADEYYRKVRND